MGYDIYIFISYINIHYIYNTHYIYILCIEYKYINNIDIYIYVYIAIDDSLAGIDGISINHAPN